MNQLRAALAISGILLGALLSGGAVNRTVTVIEGTNVNVALSPDRQTIVMDLRKRSGRCP